MTDRELMQQALEALKKCRYRSLADEIVDPAITALNERLAQPEQEPVKVLHRHEWFRTGEMKVGQMRCISCGEWGQEETPQRKEQA